MPDRYGFDHLGATTPVVACIDCYTRGPLHAWPEGKRFRHSRRHASQRALDAAKAKEERELILAGESLDG